MTDSQQSKKKTPPPFNEDSVLRGAWRRAFSRFPIKKEVLEEATRRVPRFNKDGSRAKVDSKEVLCNVCKQWVKASLNGESNVEVDHIIPVIDVTDISGKVKDWNLYKSRLVCGKSNLQCICGACHDLKTSKEQAARQALKDKAGLDAIEEQLKSAWTIEKEKELKKQVTKFLGKKKSPETKERAAKLKAIIINKLTRED